METLSEQVETLKRNSTLILSSKGEWSLHNLLPMLLEITGTASVSVASFSLSEEAIRGFLFLKECGDITNLRCIFDYTMRSHKVDLMLFLANIADEIRTTPNHAKIILIENDAWQVAVIGSANLTMNPRIELAAVFTSTQEFNTIKEIFETAWMQAIPYN